MRIKRVDRGKNHWYIDLDDNGTRVPGVTTTTDKGLPKKALINWAGNTTADYTLNNWETLAAMPPADRLNAMRRGRYESNDEAKDRGTQIHQLADRVVGGASVTVPESLVGYVQSYVRFLDEFDVRPVHVERTVYSETHRHVGTLDLIADLLFPDMPEYDWIERMADGYVRGLIDLKTGRSGIYGETALQLAPYRFSEFMILDDGAVIEMPAVTWTGAVHVTPNGYTLHHVKAEESEYRTFLYVQQVAQFMDTSRELVSDPIVPPTTSTWRLVMDEPDPDAWAPDVVVADPDDTEGALVVEAAPEPIAAPEPVTAADAEEVAP